MLPKKNDISQSFSMTWFHSQCMESFWLSWIHSISWNKRNQNKCDVKNAHSEITRLNSSLKLVVDAKFLWESPVAFENVRIRQFDPTRPPEYFRAYVSQTPAEYIWIGTGQSPLGSSPDILIHVENPEFPPFRFIFDLKKMTHCVWVKVL